MLYIDLIQQSKPNSTSKIHALDVILTSYLTLHRQNKTGRNTAIAMVMGINQLSSDA